jgi:uncharacterized protein YjaZ
MAEAFAHEAYPKGPAVPWVQPLSSADDAHVAAAFAKQRSMQADPVAYEDWFYGRNGLPRWAGYRFGYALVESYLAKHPGVSAARLATIPASAIVR